MKNLFIFLFPTTNLKEMDIYEHKNRMLFVSFNFIIFCAISIFTISHFVEGRIISGNINLIGIILSLSSILLYKFKGLYDISVALFFATALWVIGAQNYVAPSTMKSNLTWLPLLTLVSYFLVRPKVAVKLTILVLTVGMATEVLPYRFPITGDNFTLQDQYILEIMTIICSIVAGHLIGRRISNEEMHLYKSLNTRNTNLLELIETNTALISILSHDLANQTQIAIANIYKINNKKDFSNEVAINKISKSVDIMSKIIQGVRTLKAHSSGKIQIELGPVNIIDSLHSATDAVYEMATNKDITINIHNGINEDIDYIIAEPTSLVHSVFTNILTNAIKFSKHGGEIKIKITKESDNITISVKDQGIGIPMKTLKGIFNSSSFTTRQGTDGENGIGFGLPILKIFIEKYGAELEVNSTTSNRTGTRPGTEFIIKFKSAEELPIKICA